MSSMLDDLFASNKTAEEDGIWVSVTPTFKLKIRSYQSKAVSDLRDKLVKPYQHMLRQGLKIPTEQSEEIGLQVIAGAVLVGWEGLVGKDAEGKEFDVPYSADTAYAEIKRLTKLADFIISIATDASFFRDDDLKSDGAKN